MKIGSSTASIPNPTALLFLITATALLLWPDASGVTAFLVVAAVAVPIAAFWVVIQRGRRDCCLDHWVGSSTLVRRNWRP